MVSTLQLDYDPKTGVFTAEMSMLQHTGFAWEQAYPDACDAGITVVSHATGRHIMFVVYEEDRSEDGIRCWRLKPAKRFPDARTAALRLYIYNT